MIWFVLCGVLLVALVLALLLPPLLRRPTDTTVNQSSAATPSGAGLAILREQLAQLEADREQGLVSPDQYQFAREELARRALEEAGDVPASASGSTPVAAHVASASRRWPAVLAVSLLVPLMAVMLYTRLGAPEALQPAPLAAAPGEESVTQAQVEAMVTAMAARLESLPPGQADPEGWALLARAMAALQRYPDADRAFARAIEMAPRDAQLLADRADLLALMQGGKSAGEPTRLVDKALALDPKNLKALALAGSAAFERADFAAAIGFWQRARVLAPPGSEFANGLDRSLEAARSSAGQVVAAPARPTAPAAATVKGPIAVTGERAAPVSTVTTDPASAVSGTVRLAPALASRVGPGDTLFVFARAAQGPRMPLAILRLKASELPARFTLDDQLAMSPNLRLSRFPEVVVSARISRSGEALPQPGDLVGQSDPVKLGARGIELTINQVQP